MSSQVTFSNLPPEMVWEIVRKTDPQNLRFRLVCKDWSCAVRVCLTEVSSVLKGKDVFHFPCRFRVSPDWSLTRCCEELKKINEVVSKTTVGRLLCSTQLEGLEQKKMTIAVQASDFDEACRWG